MALNNPVFKTGSLFIEHGITVIHVRLWDSAGMTHARFALQLDPLITICGPNGGPECTRD
eukprot:8614042-Karenia_brevis.AAC.1